MDLPMKAWMPCEYSGIEYGLNTYRGMVTYPGVAEAFALKW